MEGPVAYFSCEFGLDESLPIYSGGLGVLAGDFMKAADDLQLPVVGVGIFYRKGYFQQRILADGTQEASYPTLRPEELPIDEATDSQGRPVVVQVPIAGRQVHLKVWTAKAGQTPIYLLDADIAENAPDDRRLTDRLYGGNQDDRICHEIILGIGGVRALRALDVSPAVWHMNEGHAAFLTFERLREYSADGIPFYQAVEAVKSNTVFTTHTPVPAGHDVFSIALMNRYLGDFYWQMGADEESALALGRVPEGFNMTRLATQLSSRVNAVSRLHGTVTREMFHTWTPWIPSQDISVDSITNGVHTTTWLSPSQKALYDEFLGADWYRSIADAAFWKRVYDIPDTSLWMAHQEAKQAMINQFELPISLHTLVIGFARRFATYKRATLVFDELARLQQIVQNSERPVALVFSGKAHPNDAAGQSLIRRIIEIANMEAFQGRVFFIENYDLAVSKRLVSGCDVWLNTPEKPMEASGTSGQKAGLNGVLNCSVADGWWHEGFNGSNGWVIQATNLNDGGFQSRCESNSIYQLLEELIVPMYYEAPVPTRWIAMMKESIASISPTYSMHRMVNDYWQTIYQPTYHRSRALLANQLERVRWLAEFKQFILAHWCKVNVLDVRLEPTAEQGEYTSIRTRVVAVIHTDAISVKDLSVEAVGSDGGGGIWHLPLNFAHTVEPGLCVFDAIYPGTVEAWFREHANVRVFPAHPDFTNRFEMALSVWGNSATVCSEASVS